jgi:hypothetical protein
MTKLYALHDPDLNPRTLQVPGMGDDGMLINIDMAILMARDGGTPKAKHVYRLYLKHRRALARKGVSGRKMREEAFFAALEETGAKIERKELGEAFPNV